jgi:hypothetical protein
LLNCSFLLFLAQHFFSLLLLCLLLFSFKNQLQ